MLSVKLTLHSLLIFAVGWGDVRAQLSSVSDPASFVLPFIGTTNGGHVFPGEVLCIAYQTSGLFAMIYRCDIAPWNG
jgi:hypothetical protein